MVSKSQYGRENNAMVNALKSLKRIHTNTVEKVFRAVDRGDYVTPDDRYLAYMQQPWRSGHLHLSAPCIYGEVVETLNLRPGQSFLNVGSGTGYLNTVVGLILGCSGINHGVEVHADLVDYANQKLEKFVQNSPALDELDFCAPKFYCGNGLCLSSDQNPYDRMYCGADCPGEFLNHFKLLLKIGGILVLPSDNKLWRIERTTVDTWISTSSTNVAFSRLKLPTTQETLNRFTIEWSSPQRLQILSYAVVRKCMRAAQLSRRPRVYEPLLRNPGLTDFDVNELLRLIISMNKDQNSPLPLSGSPYEKQNNVREEDSDDIKFLDSTNKPLENKTELTSSLSAPELPKFLLETSIKPIKYDFTFKDNANTSSDKSMNITETNKDVQKINGIQGIGSSLFHNLQKPSDLFKANKESDLAVNNNNIQFDDKDEPVNITDSKNELQKKDKKLSTAVKSMSFVETRMKPEKKEDIQGFHFCAFTQNSNLQKNKKEFHLPPSSTDASDSKIQSAACNISKWSVKIDSSKVFKFSDGITNPFSSSNLSSLKTGTQDRTAEACSNKLLNEDNEVVEKSTSVSPKRVTEPTPAVELNSSSEIVKDIRLSVLVKNGIMEVQLPYEQKESTNITFTKMDDESIVTSVDKSSSQPNISKTSETQPVESQGTYKSDIFQRLKVTLSPMSLTKTVPPVTVHISLKTLNYYSAWIWDSMMMKYDKLDNEHYKAVFQKGALLLAEAKVAFAQRTISHTPIEELRYREMFTDEELLNFKAMASKLPLPLAAYLECIGNTNNGEQLITPVIVKHALLSGAPSLMLSLFKQLRSGVPLKGSVYRRARALGLPMLHWEDVPNMTLGAEQGPAKVRITLESFNFWVTTRNGCSVIKWDAIDCSVFKKIVLSLDEKCNHNVDFDLSHGMGSRAQLVQTADYKVDEPTKWFTSVPVDDDSIKLGAAFAFHCPVDEQGATVPPQTYMTGQITPRRVMFAILWSIYHS